MSKKIVPLNQEEIKDQRKEFVWGSVAYTLPQILFFLCALYSYRYQQRNCTPELGYLTRNSWVETFLGGGSVLILGCAMLAGIRWSNMTCMNRKHLETAQQDVSIADWHHLLGGLRTKCA